MDKTHNNRWRWIVAAACILLVLIILNAYGNANIKVTRYSLKTEKTGSKLRIAQISDFHNDKKLGNKLIDTIKKQNPDLIALTGDFIDSDKTDIPYALSTVKKLTGIAPVYFVTGNHEIALSLCREFKQNLEKTGVKVLEGGKVEISKDVFLYGIDDPLASWDYDADAEGNMEYILRPIAVDKSKYNILLSHRPEAFPAYFRFDLVLTGHAHGGQFRIPFIGGIIAPGQGLFPKYDAGMYRKENTTMIVSRGIGNSMIPIRINNRPELVVVDIA